MPLPPHALFPALLAAAPFCFTCTGPAQAGQADIPLLPSDPASHSYQSMEVKVLPNGNLVVLAPDYSVPGPRPVEKVGAVYLFDSATLRPLGVLTGATAGDRVGSGGIQVLPNGNFLIRSPEWDNGTAVDAGAITWCAASAALPARISEETSLVGGSSKDWVGLSAVHILKNGNYVMSHGSWRNAPAGFYGAVTWGGAEKGVSGLISPANSLTGSSPADTSFTVTSLENGNYVVGNSSWSSGGAWLGGSVTWCSGAEGRTGVVSAANSLTGSQESDHIGKTNSTAGSGICPLPDGNYVVISPYWDNGGMQDAGAVTWCSGTEGRTGPVSAANSLVGGSAGALVGSVPWPIIQLGNGNYLVRSGRWELEPGSVTWCSGAGGRTGVVSADNSLMGVSGESIVITGLAGGGYLITDHKWNEGRGAVTWGSGTAGAVGVVSAANSLVGTAPGDSLGWMRPVILSNGNYVVPNALWDHAGVMDVGAVTWGSGTAGVTGVVSPLNSLTGTFAKDGVGSGISVLPNGNYMVLSPGWGRDQASGAPQGAVTWGDGTSGTVGAVSEQNSLVGGHHGLDTRPLPAKPMSIIPLGDRHCLVVNPAWNQRRGAVTRCGATAPTAGVVSADNSLIGAEEEDGTGFNGVTVLSSGHYVINSRSAVTWNRMDRGITGVVSAGNSLMGTPYSVRRVIVPLTNGNYVVSDPDWGPGDELYHGAVTWCRGTEGRTGVVSAANSLVGSYETHAVGFGGVTPLANGNYVVSSPDWGGVRGAVTWCSGAEGRNGPVSEENSLVGTGNYLFFDHQQAGAVTALPNGNYLVASPQWSDKRGAVTWGGTGRWAPPGSSPRLIL